MRLTLCNHTLAPGSPLLLMCAWYTHSCPTAASGSAKASGPSFSLQDLGFIPPFLPQPRQVPSSLRLPQSPQSWTSPQAATSQFVSFIRLYLRLSWRASSQGTSLLRLFHLQLLPESPNGQGSFPRTDLLPCCSPLLPPSTTQLCSLQAQSLFSFFQS